MMVDNGMKGLSVMNVVEPAAKEGQPNQSDRSYYIKKQMKSLVKKYLNRSESANNLENPTL